VSSLATIIEQIKGIDLERMAGLRPNYPPVAVEMDRHDIVLVRLKRKRSGHPTLEQHKVRPMPEQPAGGSILRPNLADAEGVAREVARLYEMTGTKPGRVSLVLPDNLAKVSLLSLPERPPSRKQLDELIRFKVRRSVPFRLEEATLSYQLLPGEGKGLRVLVALLRQGVVEQYERVLESVGARVGLIDLCTPNLYNLCREQIRTASLAGGDVALLNCTRGYFSLLIVRGENLIFYRCKSYALAEREPEAPNGAMARELAGSLSYYQEKLGGDRIGVVFLRTVAQPFDELAGTLADLGVEQVEPVDPSGMLDLVEGLRLDAAVAQRIAPAVGAAAGRA